MTDRTRAWRRRSPLAGLAGALALTALAAPAAPPYRADDFEHVRKFDAHVHANSDAGDLLKMAVRDGFELLSINVDYPDFPPLDTQARIAHTMQAADPEHFHFATTFSMQGFGEPGWTAATIQHIDAEIAGGARAVKIWKNVGMVEKSPRGQYILIDDPGFDALARHLEQRGIPLIAHQAEPRNCWLPLAAMTTDNDRSYFKDHPDYYMFLHPERASYESLMDVRDRFVARHRRLRFIGAHLASLEWSIDRIATFLDRYPNATVDMAARMSELQYQSQRDYEGVRRFLIKYQHRILYGTDLTEEPADATRAAQNPPTDAARFAEEADAFWRSDFRYLATTGTQRIEAIHADVRGLALPREVIDRLYLENARRVFAPAPPATRRQAHPPVQTPAQ